MSTISFYPFSEATAAFAPEPKAASKFVPEWYRETAATVDVPNGLAHGVVGSTIKKCMPIFDLLTSGYMLTAPCDIYLDATNPEKLEWSVPQALKQYQSDLFSYHSPEQYENYPINPDRYHKQLFRIMPTWAVGTEEGYSTLFMNPHHTDASPLWAFSAIVDTDKFITDGHLSFLVEKGFKGVIKQGTPLVQVIPFKREEWVSEVKTTDDSDAVFKKQRLGLRSVFQHAYKLKFRSKKEYK